MDRSPPPALARWLDEHLPPGTGELALRPLALAGDSNQMLKVDRGEASWILRSPPPTRNDPSAHDVVREYRMLRALDRTTVPHPRPVALCEDVGPLDVPFYVMERVDGFGLTDPLPAPFGDDVDSRRDLGVVVVDALAEIGRVPWRDIGLGGFGRPDGFLERQVSRWLKQLGTYEVRELPGLDEVAAWLRAERPPDGPPGVLHGDFHARNVLLTAAPALRVAAVVDWEMATIGDPLLDLGLLLGSWSHAGEPQLIAGSASGLPGMATRAALAARYEERTGVPQEAMGYYMALALFKLGCILEGSYARHRAGTSEVAAHAGYETLVPLVIERAHAITCGRWGIDG